jgi:uncharacterized protein (DUF1778 family)
MMSEFENMSQIDDADWGEPVSVTVRRNVTISVRFSAEEIDAIRQQAAAAGMKVTAYIRQAAISGGDTIDRDKVASAVAAVSNDLDRVRRLIQGAA